MVLQAERIVRTNAYEGKSVAISRLVRCSVWLVQWVLWIGLYKRLARECFARVFVSLLDSLDFSLFYKVILSEHGMFLLQKKIYQLYEEKTRGEGQKRQPQDSF